MAQIKVDHLIESYIKNGYRKTSNKYRIISRIDRPDWKEYMAKKHCSWSMKKGMDWVNAMSTQPGSAEDFYRRMYSKDVIEGISTSIFKHIPSSDWDSIGYVEMWNWDEGE